MYACAIVFTLGFYLCPFAQERVGIRRLGHGIYLCELSTSTRIIGNILIANPVAVTLVTCTCLL